MNPPQSRALASTRRYLLLDGGWRAGKTAAALWKLYKHAEYYDGKDGRPGPARVLVVKETYSSLLDSVIPDFEEIFADQIVAFPKSFPRVEATLRSGQKFFFRPVEDLKGARRKLGITISAALLDQAEGLLPETFPFIDSRVSMKGVLKQTIMTSNPEGHDWLYQMFIRDAERTGPGGDVEYIPFDTYDNKANLDPDFLAQIEKYPEWIKRRYIHGARDEFAGLIWSEFNEAVHVVDNFEIPPDWPRYRGLDFGYKAPTCCLWAALSPAGFLFFYREYYEADRPLDDHVLDIHDLGGDETYMETVMDSQCFAKDQARGDYTCSIADFFIEGGINVDKATKDWPGSAGLVRNLLQVDHGLRHPLLSGKRGAPRLFVMRDCQHLIDEIQNYKAEKLQADAAGNIYGRDVAQKGPDHACDAMRYLCAALRDEFIDREMITPEQTKPVYDPYMPLKRTRWGRLRTGVGWMGA